MAYWPMDSSKCHIVPKRWLLGFTSPAAAKRQVAEFYTREYPNPYERTLGTHGDFEEVTLSMCFT